MPDKPRHGEVEVDTIAEAVAAPQTTDQHRTLATLAETATPVENQDIKQRNALTLWDKQYVINIFRGNI